MRRQRIMFLAKFFFLIVGLYLVLAIPLVDRTFVTTFSAGITAISGSALNLIGEDVVVEGTQMRSPTFAVDVKNGCNGLEAMLLIISAMIAFPAAWTFRIAGILLGSLLIQFVNIFRIDSLFILGRDYPHLFETFHVTVWQVIIFLLSIGIFIFWSGRARRPIETSS